MRIIYNDSSISSQITMNPFKKNIIENNLKKISIEYIIEMNSNSSIEYMSQMNLDKYFT